MCEPSFLFGSVVGSSKEHDGTVVVTGYVSALGASLGSACVFVCVRKCEAVDTHLLVIAHSFGIICVGTVCAFAFQSWTDLNAHTGFNAFDDKDDIPVCDHFYDDEGHERRFRTCVFGMRLLWWLCQTASTPCLLCQLFFLFHHFLSMNVVVPRQ